MSTSWLSGLAFAVLAVTLLPGRWLKLLLLALTKLDCRLTALATVGLSAAWHFNNLLPNLLREATGGLVTVLVQRLPDWLPNSYHFRQELRQVSSRIHDQAGRTAT
jgi:hypothetical protein